MTTAALPTHFSRQHGLELLVSRLAVSMLRWSQHRTASQRVSHEQMMLLRQIQKESAGALDLSRLGRLS